MWKRSLGVMVITSTFVAFSLSSMTCLRIVRAVVVASVRVMLRWNISWRLCWAPSAPDPMAFASNSTKVPIKERDHLKILYSGKLSPV